MFVFEKLEVYQRSVQMYAEVNKICNRQDEAFKVARRQLLRASLSVSLNIAEGSGKNSLKDRWNFLLISRGSLYETVAVINGLKITNHITETKHSTIYSLAEEVSKMLYRMIQKIDMEIASGTGN
jgi:four helix bundle protein